MDEIKTRQIRSSVPEVNVNNTSAEDRLYEFVEAQIDKMRSYGNFNGLPGFYEISKALVDWNSLNCSMITLDVMSKVEYQTAKNKYEEFMAEKYMIARSTLNPTSLTASKWASSKEIEFYIMNNWKDEYTQLRDEMNIAETKLAFVRRLLDNLESYKYNLTRLARNVEVETLKLNMSLADID